MSRYNEITLEEGCEFVITHMTGSDRTRDSLLDLNLDNRAIVSYHILQSHMYSATQQGVEGCDDTEAEILEDWCRDYSINMTRIWNLVGAYYWCP